MTKPETRGMPSFLPALFFTLSLSFGMLFFPIPSQAASSILADSTKQCLEFLDANFSGENAEQFIGLDGLNITDEQYEIIRDYTLELTKGCKTDSEKIQTVYYHLANRVQADVGPAISHDNATCNDPYPMFKNMGGVCQGYSNLCRTMLTALDIPCIISHGFYLFENEQRAEGHAWDLVYCDGHWGIVDASMIKFFLMFADREKSFSFYSTTELEQVLYTENDLEFSYYDGGLGVIGYSGDAEELIIPENCQGHRVVSVHPHCVYSENSLASSSVRRIVIPATVEHGILAATLNFIGEESANLVPFSTASLAEIEVDENNPVYASYKGVLYDKAYSRILCIPNALTDVELKPLEYLEKNTIYSLPNLRTLKIAEGTAALEEYAIENCPALEKISIPDSVTEIADNAFYSCAENITVYASEGSAGAAFASKNNLPLEDLQSFGVQEKADYSALEDAVSQVPTDLSKYTDETVSALQLLLDKINWNYTSQEQDKVNQAAADILLAIQNLKEKETEPQKPATGTDDNNGTDDSTDKNNNGTGGNNEQNTGTDSNNGKDNDAGKDNTPGNPAPDPGKTSAVPTPKKVTGLKVTYRKSGKALLSWKKQKSVTGYQVFRYQNGKWVKVKTLKKKTSLTVKRNAKKTYQYKIRAYIKSGKETSYGAYSKKVKVRKS